MDKCSETGCNEKAKHKYRSYSGMRVLLCDKHYKKWEKYEYKPPPMKKRLRTLWGQIRVFWGKAPSFMLSPTKAFKTVENEDWTESIGYFTNFLTIFAILSAVAVAVTFALILWLLESFLALFQIGVLAPALELSITPPIEMVAIMAIAIFIGGLVGVFIGGLWVHMWVYAVGGREGVGQTMKAMAYGSTPALLLGWIPIINLIAVMWSMAISIMGMKELHKISVGRVFLAYILSLVVGIPLTFIISVTLFIP